MTKIYKQAVGSTKTHQKVLGYRLLNNKMCPLNIPEVPHSLNSFRIQTRLWSVNSSLLQIPQAFIDGILRKVHRSLVTWNAPSKKGKFEIFLGKVPPNNRYIIWIFTFFIFLNVFKVPHLARSQSNHIWCSLSECCGFLCWPFWNSYAYEFSKYPSKSSPSKKWKQDANGFDTQW